MPLIDAADEQPKALRSDLADRRIIPRICKYSESLDLLQLQIRCMTRLMQFVGSSPTGSSFVLGNYSDSVRKLTTLIKTKLKFFVKFCKRHSESKLKLSF